MRLTPRTRRRLAIPSPATTRRGRKALYRLTAAHQGREVTAADLRRAERTPLRSPAERWEQVPDEFGGHLALRSDAGPGVTRAVEWLDCDCGGQSPEGEPLPGCGPGCPRGSWQGPLVWAAQDQGVPGLWGLTESEMFSYLLPRWRARGITPASQAQEGRAARKVRAPGW